MHQQFSTQVNLLQHTLPYVSNLDFDLLTDTCLTSAYYELPQVFSSSFINSSYLNLLQSRSSHTIFTLNYLKLLHVISKFLRLLEIASVASNYFYSQVTSGNLNLSQHPQVIFNFLVVISDYLNLPQTNLCKPNHI
jgi:hypothetical protein